MASTSVFRFVVFALLTLSSGVLLNACITPPDYPDKPSIDFKEIKSQRISKITGTYDTVTVTVAFKDGDGDLGLAVTDTAAPFNEFDANGNPNRYYNNYFFQPFKKDENGIFQPVNFSFSYDSRFPRLTDSDRKEPIKGDLSIGLKFFRGSFEPGSEVRFEVSILDRALHESNKVTTSSIIIP